MPQFTDRLNRVWVLRSITYADLEPLKALGLDVEAFAGDTRTLETIVRSSRTFGQVMWYMCDPESKGVSQEEFARGFDGPTILGPNGAGWALEDAILCFSHSPEIAKALMERRPGLIAKETARLVGVIAKALDGSSNSAASLPESPESIPTDGVSAS